MEKCNMCNVLDDDFVDGGMSNDNKYTPGSTHFKELTISDLNNKLLLLLSQLKSEIFIIRSYLHIPLQAQYDYDYILNWCDMNYGNADIRPQIDALYTYIDMYYDIKMAIR
jgi:hypothetical protein